MIFYELWIENILFKNKIYFMKIYIYYVFSWYILYFYSYYILVAIKLFYIIMYNGLLEDMPEILSCICFYIIVKVLFICDKTI